MASDDTLAGYQAVHGRAPAFEGSDERAYSVGVFSDDDPGADGLYGAALIFIRWSDTQAPEGHLESDYIAFAPDPAVAEAALGRMTLAQVKATLEALIARKAGLQR